MHAGLEHRVFKRLNADMSKTLLVKGKLPPIKKDFKDRARTILETVDIVKDPRFMNYPEIVEVWNDVWPGMQVLLLIRRFKDVLQSWHSLELQAKRPDLFNKGPAKFATPEEMAKKYRVFQLTLKRLKIPFRIIPYPGILDQYERLDDTLRELNVILPLHAQAVWDRTIDKNLLHFGGLS